MPALLAVVIISVAAAAGFSFYQIRLSVTDVKEVFTDESSFLNGVAGQLLMGAGGLYLIYTFAKGKI